MNEKYLQKHGRTLMRLAREMMTHRPGERIATIAEYVERYGVSRGIVQAAFKELCESALSLDKRGYKGSYISDIDYKQMWTLTGWGVLVGLLSLPLLDNLRALTTAVSQNFEQTDIPLRLAFMQGADNRAGAVNDDRFDFAIMSKQSAEHCLAQRPRLKIALELAKKGGRVPDEEASAQGTSSAVIVTNRDNYWIDQLLRYWLQVEKVQEVMEKMEPDHD